MRQLEMEKEGDECVDMQVLGSPVSYGIAGIFPVIRWREIP